MLEKLIFSLLACSLFIIIFFKIIRRNDANYIILLVLQAIGIAVAFVEIHLQIGETISSLDNPLSILIELFFSNLLNIFFTK